MSGLPELPCNVGLVNETTITDRLSLCRRFFSRGVAILFVVLVSAAAHQGTAFADSRVAIDYPQAGAVLSGFNTLWGWALYDTTAVSNISLTLGNTFEGYGYYGYSRPDVCNAYPTWAGCSAGSNNVGWQLPLDTTMIPQGGSQSLTITAGPLGTTRQTTVTIDQPPTITLSSPAPFGSGNATFSFTVKSSTGMSNEQWINGMIAPSLGATPACSFSYWVNSNAFALINDAGNTWQYGTLNSGLSNSECRINTDSSYIPSGDTGSLARSTSTSPF